MWSVFGRRILPRDRVPVASAALRAGISDHTQRPKFAAWVGKERSHRYPPQEEVIEATIGFGQLEELIEQGKDEMELIEYYVGR